MSPVRTLGVLVVLLAAAASHATEANHAGHPVGSRTHPAPAASEAPRAAGEPAFLVVAGDRGFLGNEEIRDAFAAFRRTVPNEAALVLITDERSEARLRDAVAKLRSSADSPVVVLPLFLSDAHPRYRMARAWLAEAPLRWAPVFGESYFAVEVLADRLRAIDDAATHNAVILAHGASDPTVRATMEADLDRLAAHASDGLELRRVKSLVHYDRSATPRAERRRELEQALAEEHARPGETAVLSFNLGFKLDTMMSLSGFLRRGLPEDARFVDGEVLPHPAVSLWMAREANRRRPLELDDLGVVFLAHGADFEWNETMRQAAAPLASRYRMEFALSMADPPVVERAVRRLEARGARAIVVVRVFGLRSSFEGSIARMFGDDVEHLAHLAPTAEGGGHGGHGGHGMGAAGPRIRTATPVVSVGGLEDDALFAEALLARARELSDDPGLETIVLVAHGAGQDARNDHWKALLESLAAQMRSEGGGDFRAIETGTWREDWPDKREPEVARIRALVEAGSSEDGRVIVVPARTTGVGPASRFLEGLEYRIASGFAPSDAFERWLETQILAGARQLGAAPPPVAAGPTPR